jgi:hypothetical protein
VLLPIMTVEPISVSVTPLSVATWVEGVAPGLAGGVWPPAAVRVVLPMPTPLGPMEIVCSSTTVVVGVAPGPIV